MHPVIVLTTVGENFDARELARHLVDHRLAACVNIVPNLFSMVRWRGNISRDYEQLLLIKTDAERIGALKTALFERHPYEVPEFIVVPVETVEGAYAEWLAESLADAPQAR